MKKLFHWFMVHSGRIAAALALLAATTSMSTTCIFDSYQPKLPECLRES